MDLQDRIEALQADVKEMKSLLAALIEDRALQQGDEMLTVAEAAELLKVSEKTIIRYVHQKSMPYSRPSGKPRGTLRFSKAELLKCNPAKKGRKRTKRTNEVSIL